MWDLVSGKDVERVLQRHASRESLRAVAMDLSEDYRQAVELVLPEPRGLLQAAPHRPLKALAIMLGDVPSFGGWGTKSGPLGSITTSDRPRPPRRLTKSSGDFCLALPML